MVREQQTGDEQIHARAGEEGYLLLGAIVAIALVMIALSVAAVKVSFELRREREEESVRRANQYVRAIREFYLKFGRYPGSVQQLENTNNIRFLRQKYIDPLTGKPDYRLIIVGQNKTTPKGFFGESLSGLPGSTGPGAGSSGNGTGAPIGAPIAGNGSTGGFGTSGPGGAFGGGNGNAATMGFGGGGGIGAGAPSGIQTTAADVGATQSPGAGSSSSTTGSGPPGSNMGPIMGVGTSATGDSIITVNEQNTYDGWEFLYDPRVERLRQQGQLNSGVGSAGGSANPAGLGGAPQSGPGGTGGSTPGAGSTQSAPTTGTPVQP